MIMLQMCQDGGQLLLSAARYLNTIETTANSTVAVVDEPGTTHGMQGKPHYTHKGGLTTHVVANLSQLINGNPES